MSSLASICCLLEWAVEHHGREAAVVTDGEVLTYDELADRALRVGRLLGSRRGGRRIAVLAENGPTYVALYWGILLSGGTTVELNPGLAGPELRSQLAKAEPGLLVADAEHHLRLDGLGRTCHGNAVSVAFPAGADVDPALVTRIHEVLDAGSPKQPRMAFPRPAPDGMASIVQTSGTTGQVKGAGLTHRNLAFVTESIVESFGLIRGGPAERFFGNLPLYYTYGKSVLLAATYLGAPVVFTRRVLTARTLWHVASSARVTHLSLVPYYCSLLLADPRFTAEQLPDLRRVTIAGGALHPAGLAEMLRRFPGRVVPMYGLTEASTRVTCMPPDEVENRPASCGRAIPGVEIRILDGDGRRLAPLEEGEVVVRGDNVMAGYFNDPEATQTAIRDGWLRTGDVGFLDADGYLTISGRRKDMVKVMGESVSALSVESVIAGLPGVAEVAVKGVPDPQTGEAICAFVVPREGAAPSVDEIRLGCLEALGRSRVPAHVRFREALPKTESGKIRKHLLILDSG